MEIRSWVGILLTMGALGLAGCGDPPPDPAEPAPETADPAPFAPGLLPQELEQYRVSFTPSGDTAYLGAGEGFFPISRQATLYRLVRSGGEWGGLETAGFSGEWSDIDPFITPDGRFLYFSSIRPGSIDGAADLWRVERAGTGWGAPERLAISSDRDELFPSLDGAGRLFFARPVPDRDGEWGIWMAEPDGHGFGEPRPLGPEVNRPGTWNFNPAVLPGGDRLLFTRLVPADAQATGFGRIHLAQREGEGWAEARPLASVVNSAQDEFHPSLSPDGRTLYFVRRDPFAEAPRGRLLMVPLEGALPR